jgi:Rrf2 family transcriptional regulator, iron-sulfur cluster assembly transcription factor
VTRALERSLDRARLQALEDLRLEDLLFDLRSAEAGATSEAGLLLG